MAQNTTITVPPRTWTQLTNADATAITIQVQSTVNPIFVKGTVGAVPPTSFLGCLQLNPPDQFVNQTLAHFFPGVAGVTRLYAYSEQEAQVFISHA